jgi:hypothetical protein
MDFKIEAYNNKEVALTMTPEFASDYYQLRAIVEEIQRTKAAHHSATGRGLTIYLRLADRRDQDMKNIKSSMAIDKNT